MTKSKLFRVSFLAALLVACSGGDDTTDAGDEGGIDAAADQTTDVTVKPDVGPDTSSSDTGNDVTVEAAADAGDAQADAITDGGVEADVLAPEGTPCTPPNSIQSEGCGLCGTQYRGCFADGDGGYTWGSWGFCQGQVVNGCDPNATYQDTACGNCGTKKQVCLSNCTFDLTQTCTEPLNACKPTTTQFQLGLSCDAGGRERTCDSQCSWGNYGACQAGPTLPKIQVPGTVGAINSLVQTFDSNVKLPRVGSTGGACPVTVSTTVTVYNYIVIENNTGFTATVDVFHSTAPSSVYVDSVMAVYAGAIPPDDNNTTARGACVGFQNDTCTDTTNTNPASCFSSWAGLMKKDSHAVVINPGASVVLYSAGWSSTATNNFQINVKTQSLL